MYRCSTCSLITNVHKGHSRQMTCMSVCKMNTMPSQSRASYYEKIAMASCKTYQRTHGKHPNDHLTVCDTIKTWSVYLATRNDSQSILPKTRSETCFCNIQFWTQNMVSFRIPHFFKPLHTSLLYGVSRVNQLVVTNINFFVVVVVCHLKEQYPTLWTFYACILTRRLFYILAEWIRWKTICMDTASNPED